MNQIEKAAEILQNGGVIAYPTDTIYGIGADIFNKKAVKRVFALKGRNFKKPLSIAVANFKMIEDVAFLSSENRNFVQKLLPGPITVILPKKKSVSELITAGSELIGIRLPENKEAIEIIRKTGFPITATSANLSGEKEITNAEDINLKVDFVVRGVCKYKKPSTVVDLVNKKIIREGAKFEQVKEVLKQ